MEQIFGLPLKRRVNEKTIKLGIQLQHFNQLAYTENET